LREVRHRAYGIFWRIRHGNLPTDGQDGSRTSASTRYTTLTHQAIKDIPVAVVAAEQSHLYLWVPNALLQEGLEVMAAWGFQYKTNIIWHKIRKDGGPDGRGVGFYFRNTTEMVLFGVRGRLRTLAPGRTQVNVLKTRKREHSRKPDELYDLIEACSPGPFLELFARGERGGWEQWGHEVVDYAPSWPTYAHHSQQNIVPFDLHRRKHG
jgi:N6-adenosine-specific RNA methylase IME4